MISELVSVNVEPEGHALGVPGALAMLGSLRSFASLVFLMLANFSIGYPFSKGRLNWSRICKVH